MRRQLYPRVSVTNGKNQEVSQRKADNQTVAIYNLKYKKSIGYILKQ